MFLANRKKIRKKISFERKFKIDNNFLQDNNKLLQIIYSSCKTILNYLINPKLICANSSLTA